MKKYVLAIDQGTTSSRCLLFDQNREIIAVSQQEFGQHFPASGWVEHDPEEIWQTVLLTIKDAMDQANCSASDIAGLGITNQRETTVMWNRETGSPIYNAIVWQDRRTAEYCSSLKEKGLEPEFSRKTGLLLDPYFSGTKVNWILENVDGARADAEAGRLIFGTIDSFLIWRLTGGKVHATDTTNASRTLLFNIADMKWDDELLRLLDVPASVLPEVRDCDADFGTTESGLFGAPIPILGVAGDQQAAVIGQACFRSGMTKSTYGTGCFLLQNTGTELIQSKNKLLTTVAYTIGGETSYALEGSIFVAGAAVQWLRDGLGILDDAAKSGAMAEQADPSQDIYLVPAFTGLGAPHWDPEARGAMFGITRNSGPNEFAKAALESVCYQTRDLLEAMDQDRKAGSMGQVLRVDGGMVASDWTMQFLADILNSPVERPALLETTAMGAAWLAGSHAGIWPDREQMTEAWKAETRFDPDMSEEVRDAKLSGWSDCVRRTLTK